MWLKPQRKYCSDLIVLKSAVIESCQSCHDWSTRIATHSCRKLSGFLLFRSNDDSVIAFELGKRWKAKELDDISMTAENRIDKPSSYWLGSKVAKEVSPTSHRCRSGAFQGRVCRVCRVCLCQKALCTNARFTSASQEQHNDQRWRLQCLFASMLKKRNYLNHAFHYSEFLWTLELRILKLDCVICLRRPWQSRYIVKLSCYCMSLHSWPWKSMHRLPIQAVSGWIQICAHGFGSARSASLSHWSHCFAW